MEIKVKNYAAIDIGSNAVRLLIKSVNEGNENGDKFTKLLLLRVPLRLGEDTFTAGRISSVKKERLIRLIKAYKQLMKIYEITDYKACATAAIRDAENGKKIIRKVEKKTGIRIGIINGKEEAQLVYDNHIEYMGNKDKNYIYMDVGGGSTEINLISRGMLVSSKSYDIGTLRLLKDAVKENVKTELKNDLEQLASEYPDIDIIGTGGNINKLFRLISKKNKKNLQLPVSSLEEMYHTLKALTVEERMQQYKLRSDRADVIVPAAEIFLAVARYTGASSIYVPTVGLADGIIDSIYERDSEQAPGCVTSGV